MKLALTAIGYLVRDCSVTNKEGGNTAITFDLAVTTKYLDGNGVRNEETVYLDCTLWRKPDKLKVAEYLKKGTLIEVSGRPTARGWKAKQSDEIKAGLKLRVDDLILLAGPNKKPPVDQVEETTTVYTNNSTQEDDLPF